MSVEYLIKRIRAYNPDADFDFLRRSYEYSEKSHRGQWRDSGDPYFTHCFETAKTLVDLKLDMTTICAGLLHDVVEDTSVTRDELAYLFGETIAQLVEGVTNISKYQFKGRVQQRQAENYLKLLLATAKDIRVILIKLADRLHNMNTLSFLPPHKQEEIAKQTFEVYAPLAHRLGIARIRSRLEDLSFKYLYPTEYKQMASLLSERLAEREAYTKRIVHAIQRELNGYGIEAQVDGRSKHIHSIYRKIHEKGTPFEEIFDLTAARILVKTQGGCYVALGALHKKWYHIPERFKDFIGLPKANGYQSLHTTILDRERPVEIQIRTHEMHQIAEYGIAAHWSYKEGVPSKTDGERIFAWFRDMLDEIQELKDPYQFIRSMKGELFPDEVYVFTPNGDLHCLPAGSTSIDFAYKIHTEVGQSCHGAEVNGGMVPLKYHLQTGDRVKILTHSQGHPSRDWLRWVKTARARNKIRHWLNEQDRAQAIELGKKILELEMRRQHLNLREYIKSPELGAIAEKLKLKTVDDLFMQIGNGKQSATHVVNVLRPEPEPPEEEETVLEAPRPEPAIQLEGIDLDAIRIMKCCNPIPGDEILGYITRGRGVSIHKVDCPRILNEPERMVHLEWKSVERETYPATIAVECDDCPGMLGEIASSIALYKVNIVQGNIGKTRSTLASHKTACDQLTLAVNGLEQLEAVMESIRCLKGVRSVTRTT
ncbi:MAG: bifunctional (p)ppGpp synthetase/guanosine-3',5'-bis(diphosphate) 3'-pyrophosphohydrolase [Candidatus Poribacteria bacterium]|nr:bifunctional (p)ppGpp synthetase/guanosine-3',5'-bis(diphosphate) 3'-pyrophosphohydrolase [Candidatus Poribacteria bacterium]